MKLFGRNITFANKKKPTKPDLSEIARIRSLWSSQSLLYSAANEEVDTVLASKGLQVYERDMMADDQVKAAVFIKKLGVVVGGYQITPAVGEGEEGYGEAQEIADFVEYCIIELKGAFNKVIMNITNALVTGFSVQEIVWKYLEDGPYAGMIGIGSIKPKPASSFTFDMDEYGNVRQLLQYTGSEKTPIPMEKVLFYTYDWEGIGLPQGKSDLRAAYRHYVSKEALMRWRIVAAEKFACPTPLGKYPPGTTTAQQDALLKSLSAIVTDTAIIAPEGTDVELLQPKSSVIAPYDNSIDACNKGIARAIFGQVLATDEGSSGSGSYAQAKIHRGILGMYLDTLREEIAEDVLFEQLVKRLVDYNYNTDLYPKIVLAPPDDRDLNVLADIMDKMIKDGVVDPNEPFVREEFGFPPKPEELIEEEEIEETGTEVGEEEELIPAEK